MKTCTKCNKVKNDSDFRVRKGKKKGQSPYLNSSCRECDAKCAREYYQKVKDYPEFKKKNQSRVKEYNKKTGYSKKRWQKNKSSELWLNRLRQWREDNKERVRALQSIRSKKWHINAMNNISDTYIISKIREQTGFSKEDITQEMIDIKRLQILIYRN